MAGKQQSERSEDFKTPKARLSFPHLFTPQTMDDGKQKYNCTLLFSKTSDISALTKAVLEAATKAWGDKAKDRLAKGLIKSPILDGDGPQGMNKKTGETNAGYAGCYFIRVAAGVDRPPRVFRRDVSPAVQSDVYAGCFVYAVINAYTWSDPRNGDGVSFGLTYIQMAGDGEPLGGGAPPADKFFEAVPDEGDAPAATQTGEGAGGLFA
jgi:hypothetical protein